MSLTCDGKCVVVPAPFAGTSGVEIERVGASAYCATMRAYYSAVAVLGVAQSCGVSGGCGHADATYGKFVRAVAASAAAVGVHSFECGDGGGCEISRGYDSSGGLFGFANTACSVTDSAGKRSGGESVESNDDGVSRGQRTGHVSASVAQGVCETESERAVPWRAGAGVEGGWRDRVAGVGSSDVGVGSVTGSAGAVGARGRNYGKNRRKREQAKRARGRCVGVSAGFGGLPTPAGSVATVDTRTAVEIEAAQTLAARRVIENKVAAKLSEHRLAALMDTDRTDTVMRLAAARYEQKINVAKAQSQAAYKKCDDSLKSLGSTGSAGEFALKQEVKKAKENEAVHKYVQDQAELLLRYASPEVRQMVADMPGPVMPDAFEIFGDCPSDYTDDERECYYTELNMMNEQSFYR